MKKIIFSACLSVITVLSWSQSNTVTTGGNANGSGGSISYSIGQIDYANATSSNGSTNEGVQQPFEFYGDASLLEEYGITLSLFPNPTNENVMLEVNQVDGSISYQLYDLNGKLINAGLIIEQITIIPMATLSAGEYQLTLNNKNEILESLKIIKH